MEQVATQFGYTATDSGRDGAPRDVLWCPPEIALRERQEQSSRLSRAPEQNFPFLSFWRTAVSLDKDRLNVPLTYYGVPTSTTRLTHYKLRPVKIVLQLEHWASKHTNHESAIENYIKWVTPLPELQVEDANGVTLHVPIWTIDPQDNSRIAELYEVGSIFRETFTFTLGGWVTVSVGGYSVIEKVKWNIWESTFSDGVVSDSVLMKTVLMSDD